MPRHISEIKIPDVIIASSITSMEEKLKAIETKLSKGNLTLVESVQLFSKAISSLKDSKDLYPNCIKTFDKIIRELIGRKGIPIDKKQINGHSFVEMGDGLKWATCNVGATKAEEFGDFLVWAETEPYYSSFDPLTWKDDLYYGYEKSKYFSHESPYNATKYNEDNRIVLDPEDDAAKVKWGGTWRTPKASEFEKLLDENLFTWKLETQNGVEGYTVTSKIKGYEGNSIFLPCHKHFVARQFTYVNIKGAYWTCDLANAGAPDSNFRYAKVLEMRQNNTVWLYMQARCWGFPVRPVSD